MPYFICPNCKQRSIDIDGAEGFSTDAVACHHCGFGFLFELLDDYYPAPATGFVVTRPGGRILAVGRGIFEITGWNEGDLLGADLSRASVSQASRRRRIPRRSRSSGACGASTRSSSCARAPGHVKPITADFFPAYDDDGGLLVALTPR